MLAPSSWLAAPGVNPNDDFSLLLEAVLLMGQTSSVAPLLGALAGIAACSHAPTPARDVARGAPAESRAAAVSSSLVVPAAVADGPTAAAMPPPVSLEQLIEQVDALLGEEERWRSMLAPVLPCSWPPREACALFLVYESSALPTGTIQYRHRGPRSSIRCSLAPPACSRALTAPAEQDEFVDSEWSRGAPPERGAQRFLLDLLRAGQLPERAPVELGPYARWLGGQRGLGASARRRAPGFSAWLTEPASAPQSEGGGQTLPSAGSVRSTR